MPEEKVQDMQYIADQLKMLSEKGGHVALMYLPEGEVINPDVLERALTTDLNAYLRSHGYRAEVRIVLDEENAQPEHVKGMFDHLTDRMQAVAKVEGRRVMVMDLMPNPNWSGDDPVQQEQVVLSERQLEKCNRYLGPRYRVVDVDAYSAQPDEPK